MRYGQMSENSLPSCSKSRKHLYRSVVIQTRRRVPRRTLRSLPLAVVVVSWFHQRAIDEDVQVVRVSHCCPKRVQEPQKEIDTNHGMVGKPVRFSVTRPATRLLAKLPLHDSAIGSAREPLAVWGCKAPKTPTTPGQR